MKISDVTCVGIMDNVSEIKDQLTLGQDCDDLRGERARGIEDREGDRALEGPGIDVWSHSLALQ